MSLETNTVRNRRPLLHEDGDSTKIDSTTKIPFSIKHKIVRYFWNFFLLLGCLIIACTLSVVTCVYFSTSRIYPEVYKLEDPPCLTGPLKPNDLLIKSKRIFEHELIGPESIVFKDNVLFTGTADGKILQIENGSFKILTTLGKKPCGTFEDEPSCGRPLGMRIDDKNNLYVADAYLGLYSINISSAVVTQLISSKIEIDGERPKFLNDITISNDGKIYVTDSSTKWDRRHNRIEVLESRAFGRLIEYDISANRVKILKKGLFFPNGVQISEDNSHLLIAETTRARILKYHLQGPNKGSLETFIDNLPGLPDNIRLGKKGTYWISFAVVRHADIWNIYDILGEMPYVRQLMAKFIPQNIVIKIIGQPYGLIIEVDKNGVILSSLHDPTGLVVPSISEVEETDDELFLGSYFSPFISVVKKYDSMN